MLAERSRHNSQVGAAVRQWCGVNAAANTRLLIPCRSMAVKAQLFARRATQLLRTGCATIASKTLGPSQF